MKPQYLFFLMCAGFITFFSDGVSWALLAIPGFGFLLALAITFCINATMGVGLLFALASNGMWHPKFGPVALIGGLTPGFNFLPFWVGLVGAGILQDMSKEKGLLGEIAGAASVLQSGTNPVSKVSGAVSASKNIERLTTGRPPQAAQDNEPQNEREEKSRTPLNLKSPGVGINNDIARPRTAANDNTQLHAKAA